MQPTSIRAVAAVIQPLRLIQHCRPRHFVQMVVQRHRVCDQLQPIIQTAVRLDVQVDSIAVGNGKQTFGVIPVLTALVDLQFDTELPQALAVKNQFRHIVVFMNRVVCNQRVIAVLT